MIMENAIRLELRKRAAIYLFQTSMELGASRDDVIVGAMQVAATVIACSTKPECRPEIVEAVAEEFRRIVAEAFDKVEQAAAERAGLAGMLPAGIA